MFGKFLTKIFGSRNERLVRQYSKAVQAINAFEPAMQALSDSVHGIHFDLLAQARLVIDKRSQFCSQGICQGLREGDEQYSGIWVAFCQKDRPV